MLRRPRALLSCLLIATLGFVAFGQVPAINIELTATGDNVDLNTSQFGELTFGLDPASFDGLAEGDNTDPYDRPSPPPNPFQQFLAKLAFDNPQVAVTPLRKDLRYFNNATPLDPTSQVWKLDVSFGIPASDITLSWDSSLFSAGGAAFDAGYEIAEIRIEGTLVTELGARSQILLTQTEGNAGPGVIVAATNTISIDFILARDNVAPTAFDDTGVVVFRNEANPSVSVEVLANDSDADGDAITISSVSGTTTKGGTVTTDGTSVFYTPPIDTSFEVVVGTKDASHPQNGVGSTDGYIVDGVQGKELSLQRGVQYSFNVTATGNPFYIADNAAGQGTGAIIDGVTNTFTEDGMLLFTPSGSTPNTVYYASLLNLNVGWRLNIVDSVGEATGLVSNPDDEATWDTFTYSIQETLAPENEDTATVSLVVLPGNIIATRTHAAAAAVTGDNKGLEVTVTVTYSPDVVDNLTALSIVEIMPRTDDALATYTIPAAAGVSGLAVFGNVDAVTVDQEQVTFTWDDPTTLPATGPITFSYRVVGPDCDVDPDADCDRGTKRFDFGEIQFALDTVVQNPIPIAATQFESLAFPIDISPIDGLETAESDLLPRATATFDVVLRAQPSANVIISLASTDTTEGVITSPGDKQLTFTTENWNSVQSVVVAGVDDFVNDDDQPYSIRVDSASADLAFAGATAQVSVTNTDDDSAGVTVSIIDGTASEVGGTAEFTVVLDSEPVQDVFVNVISANEQELQVTAPGDDQLIFTAANWNTPQRVVITGADELIADGNQSTNIALSLNTDDPKYSLLVLDPVAIVNINNDIAGVQTDVVSVTTTESGGSADIAINLTAQPLANVDVTIQVSDENEATASNPTVTFTDSNWDTPQTVTITGVDDLDNDGPAPFTVGFSWSYSEDSGTENVSGTNLDDEIARIVVTPPGALGTVEGGSDQQIEVSLGSPPSGNVTLNISSSDEAEGTVSTNSMEFTTGNWQTPQPLTISPQTDSTTDGDALYHINISPAAAVGVYDSSLTRRIPVINQDVDGAQALSVAITPAVIDFGQLVTTESLTFHINLESSESETVVYTVAAGGAPFTTDTDSITVPANGSAAVAVTYAPTAAGAYSDAVTLTSGGDTIVISVAGSAVDTAATAVVTFDPVNILVKPEDADPAVSFDIVLTAQQVFTELGFTVNYPASQLTITEATTSIAGASVIVGTGTIDFLFNDTSITRAVLDSGTLLTVSGSAELGAAGIYSLSISNGATTAAGSFSSGTAQLIISNAVTLGSLEVSGDGIYNFDDLVLIYRNHILPFNSGNSFLFPQLTATVTTALTPEEVEANVHAVRDGGLDVDLSGVVDFDDLVLIYRNTILPFNSGNSFLFPQLTATVSTDLTPEEVEANILKILP